MDHYATRYPTNVEDIAVFLVRLTSENSMNWFIGITLTLVSDRIKERNTTNPPLFRRGAIH